MHKTYITLARSARFSVEVLKADRGSQEMVKTNRPTKTPARSKVNHGIVNESRCVGRQLDKVKNRWTGNQQIWEGRQ